MKYHALFVIFEKAAKFEIFRLLQKIGGALRVKKHAKLTSMQRVTLPAPIQLFSLPRVDATCPMEKQSGYVRNTEIQQELRSLATKRRPCGSSQITVLKLTVIWYKP